MSALMSRSFPPYEDGETEVGRDSSQNELWAAIRHNFDFLMDEGIIENCRSTESDMSLDDDQVQSFSFSEFMHQYQELIQWLNHVQLATQSRLAGASCTADKYFKQSFYEELLERSPRRKVFNEYAKQLMRRFPQRRDEVAARLQHLNEQWRALDRSLALPGQSLATERSVLADLEADLNELGMRLNELELDLSPQQTLSASNRFHPVLTAPDQDRTHVLQKCKATQALIEEQTRKLSIILKLCDQMQRKRADQQAAGHQPSTSSDSTWPSRSETDGTDQLHLLRVSAKNLQYRWHALWLKSLERQCFLEEFDQFSINSTLMACPDNASLVRDVSTGMDSTTSTLASTKTVMSGHQGVTVQSRSQDIGYVSSSGSACTTDDSDVELRWEAAGWASDDLLQQLDANGLRRYGRTRVRHRRHSVGCCVAGRESAVDNQLDRQTVSVSTVSTSSSESAVNGHGACRSRSVPNLCNGVASGLSMSGSCERPAETALDGRDQPIEAPIEKAKQNMSLKGYGSSSPAGSAGSGGQCRPQQVYSFATNSPALQPAQAPSAWAASYFSLGGNEIDQKQLPIAATPSSSSPSSSSTGGPWPIDGQRAILTKAHVALEDGLSTREDNCRYVECLPKEALPVASATNQHSRPNGAHGQVDRLPEDAAAPTPATPPPHGTVNWFSHANTSTENGPTENGLAENAGTGLQRRAVFTESGPSTFSSHRALSSPVNTSASVFDAFLHNTGLHHQINSTPEEVAANETAVTVVAQSLSDLTTDGVLRCSVAQYNSCDADQAYQRQRQLSLSPRLSQIKPTSSSARQRVRHILHQRPIGRSSSAFDCASAPGDQRPSEQPSKSPVVASASSLPDSCHGDVVDGVLPTQKSDNDDVQISQSPSWYASELDQVMRIRKSHSEHSKFGASATDFHFGYSTKALRQKSLTNSSTTSTPKRARDRSCEFSSCYTITHDDDDGDDEDAADDDDQRFPSRLPACAERSPELSPIVSSCYHKFASVAESSSSAVDTNPGTTSDNDSCYEESTPSRSKRSNRAGRSSTVSSSNMGRCLGSTAGPPNAAAADSPVLASSAGCPSSTDGLAASEHSEPAWDPFQASIYTSFSDSEHEEKLDDSRLQQLWDAFSGTEDLAVVSDRSVPSELVSSLSRHSTVEPTTKAMHSPLTSSTMSSHSRPASSPRSRNKTKENSPFHLRAESHGNGTSLAGAGPAVLGQCDYSDDSDVDDLNHVLEESRKQIGVASSVLRKQRDFLDTGLFFNPNKYHELLATCQTNIDCLETILGHMQDGNSEKTLTNYTERHVRRVKKTARRWLELEMDADQKYAEAKFVSDIYKEQLQLRRGVVSLADLVTPPRFANCTELETHIMEMRMNGSQCHDDAGRCAQLIETTEQFAADHGHLDLSTLDAELRSTQYLCRQVGERLDSESGRLQLLLLAWNELAENLREMSYACQSEARELSRIEELIEKESNMRNVLDIVSDLKLLSSELQWQENKLESLTEQAAKLVPQTSCSSLFEEPSRVRFELKAVQERCFKAHASCMDKLSGSPSNTPQSVLTKRWPLSNGRSGLCRRFLLCSLPFQLILLVLVGITYLLERPDTVRDFLSHVHAQLSYVRGPPPS